MKSNVLLVMLFVEFLPIVNEDMITLLVLCIQKGRGGGVGSIFEGGPYLILYL